MTSLAAQIPERTGDPRFMVGINAECTLTQNEDFTNINHRLLHCYRKAMGGCSKSLIKKQIAGL